MGVVCTWNVQNVDFNGVGFVRLSGIGSAWEIIGLARDHYLEYRHKEIKIFIDYFER